MPRPEARKAAVAERNGCIASRDAGAYIDVRPNDASEQVSKNSGRDRDETPRMYAVSLAFGSHAVTRASSGTF